MTCTYPDELIDRLEASSNRPSDGLQTVPESRQTVPESQANRPRDVTSTPSSTLPSAPATTPSDKRPLNESKEGTKEDRGDSYWVGTSKKHPDGYFFRAKGASEPKGNHVLVTLTGPQVQDVFGAGYDYPQIRKLMLEHARDAGLRPTSGPAAQSGVLSRAERDELYGLPRGVEVIRREPERQPVTADDTIRRLIPSLR